MFKFGKPVASCAAILAFSFVLSPLTALAECVEPPPGMINWWTADNHTFDIIGGNHGTLRNGAGYAEDGQVAQAFAFDGVDDFVEVEHDAAFNFDGSFSIDAWIFLETAPALAQFAPIVSKWDDVPEGVDHQRNYFLSVTNNVGGGTRLRCDVSETGVFGPGTVSSRVFSDELVPLGEWAHVACVFDADVPTITMYINGEPAGATPAPSTLISPTVNDPWDNDRPILIGAGDVGGIRRNFFDGLIDEVELFDRALTQDEIESIFEAGEDGKTIPITLDIKPGDGPNSINLGSKGNTPVAILSTDTFDATTIDVESLTFAGAGVRTNKHGKLQYSFEDVNGDDLLDLVAHFDTPSLDELDGNSISATITGSTNNDRCISGTDTVNIVPAQ